MACLLNSRRHCSSKQLSIAHNDHEWRARFAIFYCQGSEKNANEIVPCKSLVIRNVQRHDRRSVPNASDWETTDHRCESDPETRRFQSMLWLESNTEIDLVEKLCKIELFLEIEKIWWEQQKNATQSFWAIIRDIKSGV